MSKTIKMARDLPGKKPGKKPGKLYAIRSFNKAIDRLTRLEMISPLDKTELSRISNNILNAYLMIDV